MHLPEIRWVWVTVEIDGKAYRIRHGIIIWPEGTRHSMSRFSGGSRSGNDQCHACGHAIRDTRNWVPLVAENQDGPLSLWVGRDCARKLFGVDVSGEASFTR